MAIGRKFEKKSTTIVVQVMESYIEIKLGIADYGAPLAICKWEPVGHNSYLIEINILWEKKTETIV